MPLLGFTVMRDKIENGSKCQTIRLARKNQIKKGDKLYLYWKQRTKQCEKIGEAICAESLRTNWQDIQSNNWIAQQDGFKTLIDYQMFFIDHYMPFQDTLFDIISWKDFIKVE